MKVTTGISWRFYVSVNALTVWWFDICERLNCFNHVFSLGDGAKFATRIAPSSVGYQSMAASSMTLEPYISLQTTPVMVQPIPRYVDDILFEYIQYSSKILCSCFCLSVYTVCTRGAQFPVEIFRLNTYILKCQISLWGGDDTVIKQSVLCRCWAMLGWLP